MLENYRGRPKDTNGRMERAVRVYDLLDSLGIEYFSIAHSITDKLEKCREVDTALDIRICKNLFLCNRQQTAFYLLMMPADKPFKTRILSPQVNSSRLSFADEGHMLQYLDLLPGSVSIMGLMNDRESQVRLLIDKDILQKEWIGCHPNVNTTSIRLRMADVLGKYLPRIGHDYTEVSLF